MSGQASTPLSTILRLALRDMRGGLRGFGIFLACIALGVTAIVAVNSVSRGLTDGLAREGRTILGGDIAFSINHREIGAEERAVLERAGTISVIVTQRSMARAGNGESTLVDLKAVGADWPVAGSAKLDPPMPLQQALALKDGAYGIVAEAALAARLNIANGARLRIGDLDVELRATLVSEPDKLAGGIGFGARVLLSQEALKASGLIQPGSLTRWHYRVTLPGAGGHSASEAQVAALEAEMKKAFPDAGWEVRGRSNVSPQFSKNVERFTQFLTLVGLTALVVGGVGIANAVAGFVERKRASLATLKSLGSTGGHAFAFALAQVMAIAGLGIVIGLVAGAVIPFVVVALFGELIPVPLIASLYPGELATGALYGALTALTFALAPLGRVHDIPVAALFRDQIAPDRAWPRRRYLAAMAAAAGLLIAAAYLFAFEKRIALAYVGATLGAFILLRFVALGVMALARALPRPRGAELRLALTNIHRAGALTPAVVLSLGLGLALLVALTLIESNIRGQISRGLPGKTPAFFFMDVRSADAAAFSDFLKSKAPDANIERVPMMRGRITRVGDLRPEEVKAKENASWVLEGDRGITYSADLPQNSNLVAGEWWPKDYRGEPLVSMEREIADGLGLKIGDRITVNVLGRNMTARIANLRQVDWRSFGINFVLVFSPNTFAGAPHTELATLAFPGPANDGRDLGLLREIGRAFPTVTSVRVRDALEAVNKIVEQLALAIRGASGVAIVASILVLGGAVAAGQRARIYDAVVLKTLGATRKRLLAAYLIEYGMIGAATALFGLAAGTLAAWGVASRIMRLDFAMDWSAALIAAFGALVLTVILGLAGTWRVLGEAPARHLRTL